MIFTCNPCNSHDVSNKLGLTFSGHTEKLLVFLLLKALPFSTATPGYLFFLLLKALPFSTATPGYLFLRRSSSTFKNLIHYFLMQFTCYSHATLKRTFFLITSRFYTLSLNIGFLSEEFCPG